MINSWPWWPTSPTPAPSWSAASASTSSNASSEKSSLPLKTTTYHVDEDNGLLLSSSGSLWTISVDTADGIVEFELSTKAACMVRQFMEDALCAECKRKGDGR